MDVRGVAGVARHAVQRMLEASICGLLLGLTAVVFAQVIARYLFEAPLSWSEEMARFLMMWLGMLCAAYAFQHGSHFALRILIDRAPPNLRYIGTLSMQVGVSIFFAVLLWYSMTYVLSIGGHLAPAMQIPMEIPYASVVVGAALMLIESLLQLFRIVSGLPATADPYAGANAGGQTD